MDEDSYCPEEEDWSTDRVYPYSVSQPSLVTIVDADLPVFFHPSPFCRWLDDDIHLNPVASPYCDTQPWAIPTSLGLSNGEMSMKNCIPVHTSCITMFIQGDPVIPLVN